MIGNFRGEFRSSNRGVRLHESTSSIHLSRLPTFDVLMRSTLCGGILY